MKKFREKLKEIIKEEGTYKEAISKLTDINDLELERYLKGEIEIELKDKKRIVEITGNDELKYSLYYKDIKKIKEVTLLNNIILEENQMLIRIKKELKEGIEAIEDIETIKGFDNKDNKSSKRNEDIFLSSLFQLYDIIYWISPVVSILINNNGLNADSIKTYMEYRMRKIEKCIK